MQPVICPQCRGATSLGQENPFRPFCSRRCQLLDLGEWFEESHAIPADEQSPMDDPDGSTDRG